MKKIVLVVAVCGVMMGCNNNGGGNGEVMKSESAGKDSALVVSNEGTNNVSPKEKEKCVRVVEMKRLNERAREYGRDMTGFYCGRAAAGKNGKWGFVNMDGKMVIGAEYGDCEYMRFNGGFVSVNKDGKEGVIDTMGRVVVPFEYDEFSVHISEGMAVMKKSDVYSVCDLRSGKITEMEGYSYVSEFKEGMAVVEAKDWKGYVDRNLNVLIRVQEGECYEFCDGAGMVRSESGDYYVDKKGVKRYAPTGCKLYFGFRDGVSVYGKGERFGLIDKQMKVLTEAKYKEIACVEYLGEGESDLLPYAVREGNRWSVLDKNMKTVAQIVWDRETGFEYDNEGIVYDGECIIINADKSYLFGRNGERKFEKEYSEFRYVATGVYAAKKDGKWGAIDLNGEELVPFEYDDYKCLDRSSDGVVRFVKGGEYRYYRVKR